MALSHQSIFRNDITKWLMVRPGGVYVDCTLNGGGHSEVILIASGPDGKVVALDLDATMIDRSSKRLAEYGDRIRFVHSNFADLGSALGNLADGQVDGILADIGMSSVQLDDPERGFSFQTNGPLDMRFDTSSGIPAWKLLEELDDSELMRILYDFGDESHAKLITRLIRARQTEQPIHTTGELAGLIEQGIPKRFHPKHKHVATRTFQALRIAVNGEIDNLEKMLPQALKALKPGSGRLAMITFHSLEHRIVRRTFREWAKKCTCPPELPICQCGGLARAKLVTRKPVLPNDDEMASNPRARSAKLQVIERLSS